MSTPGTSSRSSSSEVLLVFLRLGCTCFGGPVAHLGYFREEFVARRRWLSEAEYAELVALAQTLPGPASSQVGFMVGLLRAGWLGGAAAWLGFTLPSAILMMAFAALHGSLNGPLATAALHCLQIIAVAVIAQAVVAMRSSLAPDLQRMLIALAAIPIALFAPPAIATIACIALGALLGGIFLRRLHLPAHTNALSHSISTGSAKIALGVMLSLLLALPFLALATGSHFAAVVSAFYRSGALVFGGGHVVLPLLQATTVQNGWISERSFLSGYGAAQALPGPLFTFAAYLGYALQSSPNGIAGGLIALFGIFLPGLLLAAGMLPFWARLTRVPQALAVLAGVNAAVIGVLAAAIYKPGWSGAIHSSLDVVLLLLALVALLRFKLPAWMLLLAGLAISLALAHWGWMR